MDKKRMIDTGLSIRRKLINPLEGISPDQSPFAGIRGEDLLLIQQIAQRAAKLAAEYVKTVDGKDTTLEQNPTILEMDLVLVHLRRNLDLPGMLESTPLDLFHDITEIQKNISRALLIFPDTVILRFARNGSRVNN